MKYNRILIKLSGEMLGDKGQGFSYSKAKKTAKEINSIIPDGPEISVLIGGGNIMRARECEGINRLTADFMGMTATVINALGLKSALNELGIESRILSAVNVAGITEELVVEKAKHYLKEKQVVIFAGGTGSPFFTTDIAAALRGLEINADIILKATKVDGVYSSDPKIDKNAQLYEGEISYKQAIEDNLKILEKTAMTLLEDNNLGIIVFNFLKDGNLKKIVQGDSIGTLVK
ncbi:MAG: UMP kinase [Elusimicrobiota bacterium]